MQLTLDSTLEIPWANLGKSQGPGNAPKCGHSKTKQRIMRSFKSPEERTDWSGLEGKLGPEPRIVESFPKIESIDK